MIRSALLGLALLLVAGCAAPAASAPPANPPVAAETGAGRLLVDGDATGLVLTIEDLRALGPTEVTWSHGGKTRTFTAVPLEAVLRKAGLEPGAMNPSASPSEKRAVWKLAVVATASDGFQAVFSVAEVFGGMGRTEAFVAFAQDGRPIDDGSGPLRLVVPTDGEASRCARNVERLTIVDLRRTVPAR